MVTEVVSQLQHTADAALKMLQQGPKPAQCTYHFCQKAVLHTLLRLDRLLVPCHV